MNVYASKQPSIKIHKGKLIELKEEIDKIYSYSWRLKILFLIIDSLSRQNIGKDIPDRNNTINLFKLTFVEYYIQ